MGVLVGKMAPHFTAKAVVNGEIVSNFSLDQYRGKNVLLLFYPLDFTFVCPTELHAFQEALDVFRLKNTEIVACSVDSCYSHLAWLNTPKMQGGVSGVTYPLISDLNKTIAKDYDVLNYHEGIAYRGLFLIDREGIVRHQVVNDLAFGRSLEEALRMVDALSYHEDHGEVCPANWIKGKDALIASAEGIRAYFSK